VRGRALPLLFLRDWTTGKRVPRQPAPGEQVVVVQVGNRQLGMVVESVVGREEVVVKPLGLLLHGLPGLAGATITGDGGIALILDVPGLTRAFLESAGAIDAAAPCVQAVA
jgi:two-component system chemotaxis sensor kinase CheA